PARSEMCIRDRGRVVLDVDDRAGDDVAVLDLAVLQIRLVTVRRGTERGGPAAAPLSLDSSSHR
ncbi:hypothetical protein C442_18175, partial [Haloarcula amylolytica JCM 13557]